jgi:hypothetical protein
VPIAAQVEFETTTVRNSPRGLIETTRQYRIVRSAYEALEGPKWDRGQSTVRLFHLSDTGAVPIDPPEAFINEELPPELREVFFTDGDRAPGHGFHGNYASFNLKNRSEVIHVNLDKFISRQKGLARRCYTRARSTP